MNLLPLRTALMDLRRSVPGRFFIGVYVVGLLVLLLTADPMIALIQVFLAGWQGIYLIISLLITPNPPPDAPSYGRALPGQLGFIALLLLVTLFMPAIAAATGLPFYVTNPLLYVVVPLAVLAGVFGVRLSGLGLREGYRSWAVGLVWISVNALFVIVQLVTGSFSAAFVLNRLVGNVLQNGFTEEILWRGIVQTRLSLWLSPGWGMVISALLFGLWHMNANLSMFENALAALAFCIVSQASFGIFMSIIFVRTRSILAPGIAHTFTNLNPLNFL